MPRTEVAPGIHRIANPVVNWYLLADARGIVVVDAGFPGEFGALETAVGELGATLGDVRSVLITHAHVDHLGFADRLRAQAGAAVRVPEGDAELARSPLRAAKSERNPLRYVVRHRATRRLYLEALRAGAIRAKLVREVETYAPGDTLDGGLRVVGTPGHTFGHCSLLLEDRGVLFSGDALVTRDPYTGALGPRIVARAATADSAQAKRSLSAIEQTGAEVLLPGHGEPWTGGAAAAAEHARRAGVA
jgi:glyoxylase-like metal-dependent hydrolase (beta-lactamase superfamily II)